MLLAVSAKVSHPELRVSWTPLEYKMEAGKRAGKGALRGNGGSRRVRFALVRRQENTVLTLKAMDLNPGARP